MLYPTTITSKWQMTLPKAARNALGIGKPGKVLLSVDNKKQVMSVTPAPSIFDLAGTFVTKKKINVVKTRDYFEHRYGRI